MVLLYIVPLIRSLFKNLDQIRNIASLPAADFPPPLNKLDLDWSDCYWVRPLPSTGSGCSLVSKTNTVQLAVQVTELPEQPLFRGWFLFVCLAWFHLALIKRAILYKLTRILVTKARMFTQLWPQSNKLSTSTFYIQL